MERIALFEDARRAAVKLWPLKFRLWQAAAERFYKSTREFKANAGLCWWDPTSPSVLWPEDVVLRDVWGLLHEASGQ